MYNVHEPEEDLSDYDSELEPRAKEVAIFDQVSVWSQCQCVWYVSKILATVLQLFPVKHAMQNAVAIVYKPDGSIAHARTAVAE